MQNSNKRDVDFIPIFHGEFGGKYENIIDAEFVEIQPSKLTLPLKKLAFLGTMCLALWGAKDIVGKVYQSFQIANATSPVYEEAIGILESNSRRVFNENETEKILQYDHYGIANDIKEREEKYGSIYADALIAEIMCSINEDGYHNMDRVVRYLDNVQNKEEFIRVQGYKSEKEYLAAMKEKYYQAKKEEAVRDKYLSDQSEEKGRGL